MKRDCNERATWHITVATRLETRRIAACERHAIMIQEDTEMLARAFHGTYAMEIHPIDEIEWMNK